MSEIAIALFFGLGFLLATVGYIWGLVQAFQEEVVWGLLYWFIPFAGLVFYIKKWSDKKIRKTFLIQLAALPMFLLGGIISVVSYGAEFAKMAQSGTITVEQGSSEQSPSSFPSDFSTSPSPSQEQSPSSESSPQVSETPTSAEPSFGTVGGQQYDFNKSMQLGKLAYAKGDYQTALINFNRATQANPGDVEAVKGVEDTKKAIAEAKVK